MTLDDLKGYVHASEENIVLMTGAELVDACDVQRLNGSSAEVIERRLVSVGLKPYPRPPMGLTDEVWVLQMGTAVAKLIEALEKPSPQNIELLRAAVGADARNKDVGTLVRKLLVDAQEAADKL
jgi:hypothetical protein